jgi:hypothetical protein
VGFRLTAPFPTAGSWNACVDIAWPEGEKKGATVGKVARMSVLSRMEPCQFCLF